MQGSGLVRDLRPAVSLGTPQAATLQAKLTQFAADTTRAQQMADLDALVQSWGNTSAMPTSAQTNTLNSSVYGRWLHRLGSSLIWTALGWWWMRRGCGLKSAGQYTACSSACEPWRRGWPLFQVKALAQLCAALAQLLHKALAVAPGLVVCGIFDLPYFLQHGIGCFH